MYPTIKDDGLLFYLAFWCYMVFWVLPCKTLDKLFPLVKEIISKDGILHFRRWRLLELPFLRIYLHYIAERDLDAHEHTHPWHLVSIILKGSYTEFSRGKVTLAKPGRIIVRSRHTPHKIGELHAPTYTLFLALGKRGEWGYDTEAGFIDHTTYRELKHSGGLKALK